MSFLGGILSTHTYSQFVILILRLCPQINLFPGLTICPQPHSQNFVILPAFYILLSDQFFPNLLPYKYVGDGNFTVQHLNPDFVNINGKKKLIEIFGDYYHTTLATEWADTELGKIMIYNSFGFKCLVLWDHDMAKMTDNKIATLIRRFDRRR